jgi:hypothetical protein
MTIPKRPSQTGCNWVEDCIEICTAPSVYVEEKGVRATFRNPQRNPIRKVHYDGCYNSTLGVKKADYIVGMPDIVDVIVELKGSDTNLTGDRGADSQLEYTLDAWKVDSRRAPKIAALIIFGRIEGSKKMPGRWPRARSVIQTLPQYFLKRKRILLLIHESGEKQFTFNDFLRKLDAH